jgi:2-oxo-3-hexenedioate decarboxylase
VVQSHCPGWRFEAADTVADGALHGALRIGPRCPVRKLAASGAALDERLAATEARLLRGDVLVESGRGAAVLDGPLHALRHFVLELQACPGAPDLQPGDVVTTGTWTDAWPLEPGQRWMAEFGEGLGAIDLQVGP